MSKTIELVPIGDSHIVRSRASGAVVLVQKAQLGIAQAVVDGASRDTLCAVTARDLDVPQQDAGAVLDHILSLWQEAGLFDDAPRQSSDPAPSPSDTEQYFRGEAGALTVQCDDGLIAAQLARLLGGFREAQRPIGPGVTVMIARDGDGYRVWRDGAPLWDRSGVDAARYFTLRTAAEVLCGGQGAVLHAGAVLGPNGAVAFTGTSGSGKSTTIANLVTQGFGYLADDVLPLAKDGRQMCRFPVPLGLKEGDGKLPEVQALHDTAKAQPSPRDGVTYVDLPPAGGASHLPLRALVLPRYDPAVSETLRRIAPEEALRDVLLAGAHFPGGSIRALARMLSSVPIYRLQFHSTAFVLARCREIL